MDIKGHSSKVTFLGDTGVGKTSIISFRMNRTFDDSTSPTILMKSNITKVKKNSEIYELNLIDTAGQETYDSLAPLTIRNSSFVLLIFDLSKPETINKLQRYHNIAIDIVPDAHFIVIGNKTDLLSDSAPPFTNARNFATQIDAPIVFTSAKTGENIDYIFDTIATMMSSDQSSIEVNTNNNTINLEDPQPSSSKSSCC